MMDKTDRIIELKEKLKREIIIAAGNHFEVYIDSGFIADVHKSVDEIISEILKADRTSLI